jgi:type I restriction enzyme S subunit
MSIGQSSTEKGHDDINADVLPVGWSTARMDQLLTARKGKKPHRLSASADAGFVPYIDIKTFESGRPNRYAHPDDSILVRQGDLLIVWDGARSGLVGIAPFSGALGSTLTALTPFQVDPLYLYWLLHSFYDEINSGHRGTGIPHVDPEIFWNISTVLPPVAEQSRIVSKVLELHKVIKPAELHLKKVLGLIKQFRLSVLAAACSGKLTEGWRTAEVVNTTVDRTRVVSLEQGHDLPETWETATVDSVCDLVVDCPHSTPKWTTHGVICLRTTNFRAGLLDLDEVRFVSNEAYQERIARTAPACNDVLYSREGGILGIACLFPANLKACLGQRMMLMRANKELVMPIFLMHVLNSPRTLAQVKDLTTGSASPHLNVGDIKKFPVPLPPRAEQQEIVRRVEALFALADAIEKRVTAASLRAQRLTQAVLAKAFRGELVPTEAELAQREGRTYEPASALLERIKAERTTASQNGTRTKTKKTKK